MKAIFADTFYYLALLAPNDPAHERAVARTRELRARIVTTTWVLMEVGDAMAQPENRELFVELVEGLQGNPEVKIIRAREKLFNLALDLYRDRPDKDWTLTDCTSFVVMKQERLTDALTGDHDFEQAGFNTLLK